ncbi:transposase [Streptomyces sp. NPDC001833]|uniref:transposase n=1 Tax=Streptomyces sp. NPDC001833 TaxID=3154658 RepID=UPI00333157F6
MGEDETARIACARGLLRAGVVEKTGEVLSAAVLAQRVGWAADLVSSMAAALLGVHWNAADVDLLASGVDGAGRKLPSNAWMALRRLGWTTAPAEDMRVNDRIVRMAQEQAGRLLRSAKWRADLTAGVIGTWPAESGRRTSDEWDAVRAAVPDGRDLPSSVIRSRTRQIAAFAEKHGRLPADVFELEAAPHAARMLLLSACDGQQATLARSDEPGRALLRLQLPTCPAPSSYRDWTWVVCPITLPPTIPPGALVHLPTLRAHHGRVHADLAYTHTVPKARRTGHTVALGVDWGLNTLLSAGAVRLHDNGTITALGSGAQFRAAGVLAKQHRLRREGEHLHAKADHYRRLINDTDSHYLSGKHAVLAQEIRYVADRRSNLNDALARSAARWTVDQALAAHASVIYVEDLRSMEARGMGRTLNTRLSQQVRGQIVERMRHLAAEAGIAVVTVPARGTSRHCPRCLVPLRHRKAPDRPTVPGWWGSPRTKSGGGPSAPTPNAAGRATATPEHGSASPHAAPPTKPRPRSTAPVARWSSAAWSTSSKPPQWSKRPPPLGSAGETGPRPDPPGAQSHAPRPGDAGHPPLPVPRVRRASVRRDTLTRAQNGCPAQPTGTRA